jgi:Family of unknown function (DUF6304)
MLRQLATRYHSIGMDWVYSTRYSDRHGVETTELHNDGANLSVRLRGVWFMGRDFDGLEPAPNSGSESVRSFTLWRGSLCDCTFECDIPLPVAFGGETSMGALRMRLELGVPASNGGLDRELLSLRLTIREQVYHSPGSSGWFEDELLSLQSRLPAGVYLKACINCAYSDYSPGGHGLFGGMACFRHFKQEYANVKSKDDLFKILHQADAVQETYLCEDFEKRRPHTGTEAEGL